MFGNIFRQNEVSPVVDEKTGEYLGMRDPFTGTITPASQDEYVPEDESYGAWDALKHNESLYIGGLLLLVLLIAFGFACCYKGCRSKSYKTGSELGAKDGVSSNLYSRICRIVIAFVFFLSFLSHRLYFFFCHNYWPDKYDYFPVHLFFYVGIGSLPLIFIFKKHWVDIIAFSMFCLIFSGLLKIIFY